VHLNKIFSRRFNKYQPKTKGKVLHLQNLSTQKHKIKKQYNFKKKSLIFLNKLKIWSLVTIIIFCFFLVFISSFFRIKNIEPLRSNLSVDFSEIELMLSNEIIGKHIFFLNTNAVSQILKKNFPQWKDITVKKKYPASIILKIKTYDIIGQVLINIYEERENETVKIQKKVTINELGNIAYQELINKNILNIEYTKILKSHPVTGDNLIPIKHLTLFQNLHQELLENYELSTSKIIYFPAGQEVHFNVKQFILWFDLSQTLKIQLEKLKYALVSLDKTNLEYIDLRINNRIIYREKTWNQKK